jgi:hypothetical protein
MEWSKKPDVSGYSESYVQTDGLLLLRFERWEYMSWCC